MGVADTRLAIIGRGAEEYIAGEIVKKLSAIVSGTGGGRPDMAQGGGGDVSKSDEMLGSVKGLL